MKITNNIVSAGLTQTSSLMLKSGQVVVGTITRRMDTTTAMLRVGSQLFETSFAKGLPKSNHILLRYDTMQGNRFIFTMVEPETMKHNDILLATTSNYRAFLHSLNTLDDITVFSIHKALMASDLLRPLRFTSIAPLLQRLLQRGLSKQTLQKFCYTISKDSGISVIMQLLHNAGNNVLNQLELSDEVIQDVFSMMSKEDIESLLYYASDSSRSSYTIPFYDSNGFNDAYILADKDFVCIDVTFEHLGKLNISISKQKGLSIKIYCFNDGAYNALQPAMQQLSKTIEEATGETAQCNCILRKDWEEKIIALINSMYIHYSIDFSV
jgi:hypothetical protein